MYLQLRHIQAANLTDGKVRQIRSVLQRIPELAIAWNGRDLCIVTLWRPPEIQRIVRIRRLKPGEDSQRQEFWAQARETWKSVESRVDYALRRALGRGYTTSVAEGTIHVRDLGGLDWGEDRGKVLRYLAAILSMLSGDSP